MLTYDHAGIATRIPHAGGMCLLQAVTEWDAKRIVCTASSHRAGGHPMAEDDRLDVLCGIEYAAQAMAMHGSLVGGAASPRGGYLASVRDVVCAVARLDDLQGDLVIEAEQLMGEAGRMIYRFDLSCNGVAVLSGRAAVILEAGDGT